MSASSSPEPDIAPIAALIGDSGRSAMLLALLDGREQTASALAARAGLSPQAATAHLKKLAAAGLLLGRAAGRNRLFRLASPEIGHALETLAAIAPPRRTVALSQSTALARLRVARSCYDHLAGRLGVAVTDALVERRALHRTHEGLELGRDAERVFSELGVDLEEARAQRRGFVRGCLDWTERRHHLAGSAGAALLQQFLLKRWVSRTSADRALRITAHGYAALSDAFGIEERVLHDA